METVTLTLDPATAAFYREVEKARQEGQEKLYFVVHGGIVMSVLYRFAQPKAPFYSWPLNNCQGYRSQAEEGQEGLILTNVTLLDRVGL